MSKEQTRIANALPTVELNGVLRYPYTHRFIGQQANTTVLVETEWSYPELVLTYLSPQIVLEGRAVIHRKGLVSNDRDIGRSVLSTQGFRSSCTSDAIPDNHIGAHCIASCKRTMLRR